MNRPVQLSAPQEYPQSAAPAHVKRLVRPQAWQKVAQLGFLRFEKKDLVEAERFTPARARLSLDGVRILKISFIAKARQNPLYLKPGDAIALSIRSDDGALDLGQRRTRVAA